MLELNIRKKLGSVNVDVAFSTDKKGVTAVFGQSGAGKTSVINMIAGLITPDDGYIRFNGKPLFDASQKINVPVHKRAVGYVFQDARLFPNMTVKKNLLYGSGRSSDHAIAHGLNDVCDLLGIGHLLDRMPSRLSGGEKQRVAIGRALLSNPDMLLMDEPLASLDRSRRHELMDYICVVSRDFDIPIIYVTHAIEEIVKLAGNMALLENGKLKRFGNAVDILNSLDIALGYDDRDFGVICEGKVVSYNPETELAVISFGGGKVEVSSEKVEQGSYVRFKINAIDVVLCALEPPATSVRNTYSGPVVRIEERSNHFADVLVDIGVPLWARISGQSLKDLSIEKGKNIYTLVKSAVISAGMVIKPPAE